MRIPTGPGWYIWQATSPAALTDKILESRAAWIAVKGGDGSTLMAANVNALLSLARAAGVAVYAWHVVYLKDPAGEAQVAAALKDMGVDGVIADAEAWDDGMAAQATLFLRLARAKLGAAFPFGMTGMSSPALFPTFPWAEFEAHVDFQMPQWYANAFTPHASPAAEFMQGVKGYRGIGKVPLVPIVATYGASTAQDVTDTAHLAASYGMPGWGAYRLELATPDQIAAMRVCVGATPAPPSDAVAALEARVQGLEQFAGTIAGAASQVKEGE